MTNSETGQLGAATLPRQASDIQPESQHLRRRSQVAVLSRTLVTSPDSPQKKRDSPRETDRLRGDDSADSRRLCNGGASADRKAKETVAMALRLASACAAVTRSSHSAGGAAPVTIFTPRQSRIWPARPGMILAPSRSHDPGGVVTGPGGWLVIANRGSARIS